MQHTCVSSSFALRCKGSMSFSYNDYTYCSNDRFFRHPISYTSYTSPLTCCACCVNGNSVIYRAPIAPSCLYGLRQSTLIQFTPRKKVILCGFERVNRQLSGCDKRCYCEKVCSDKVRKRYEESNEICSLDDVNDEAEVMLSLLTEDLSENSFDLRRRRRNDKSFKNVVSENTQNRENGDSYVSYRGKKKNIGSNFRVSENRLESEYESKKEDKRSAEEDERFEFLRENRKARIRKEEREELMRENRKEEREDLLRQRLSSSSSFYSVSSNGEYENETDDIQGLEQKEFEELSRKNKRDYSKEQGLVLKKGNTGVSDEWNFRKDSEKKLTDISVEEETRSFKQVHKGVYGNASYKKYDDQFNEGFRRKSSDEDETEGGSHKIHSSVQEAREEDYDTREEEYRKRSNNISQSLNSQIIDINKSSRKDHDKASSNALSSVYDAKEKQNQAGKFTRQEDLRQTYQQYERNKEESLYQTLGERNFQTKEDEVRRLNSETQVNRRTRYNTDQRRRKESEVLITSQSSQFEHNKEESSYQAFDERNAQTKEDEVRRLNSEIQVDKRTHYSVDQRRRKESDALITSQSSQFEHNKEESLYQTVDERNFQTKENEVKRTHSSKRKEESEALITPPSSQLVSRDNELTKKLSIKESSHGRNKETIEHPLESDSLDSVNRLQKASTYYVNEFVEKARNELTSSEIQSEIKDDRNTILTNYVSGNSQTRETGPTDESWDIIESSKQELPETSNVITKRNGRSMWNVISDIVNLRWGPRSNRSTKSGGKSSPNQSSETWFSGHEQESETNTKINTPQELKTPGESSTSSSSKDRKSSQSYREEMVAQNSGASMVSLSNPNVQELSEVPLSSIVSTTSQLEGKNGKSIRTTLQKSETNLKINTSQLPKIPSRIQGESSTSTSTSSNSKNHETSHSYAEVIAQETVSGSHKTVQSFELIGKSTLEGKDGNLKRPKFKRANQVSTDIYDDWEEYYRVEMEQRKTDEMFMREALIEAKLASDSWEVPVGAILVHDGKIIARGYNLVEALRDSTAHAEILCIREASKILKTWRLSDTTLYVTLEPCPMCAGAILQARIDNVVWGAPNKLLGADGSWIRLFPSGEEGNSMDVSEKPAPPVHPFHPRIKVRRNVLASECAEAMQQFFQLRRKKKDGPAPPTPPPSLSIADRPSKFFNKLHDVFHGMFCL